MIVQTAAIIGLSVLAFLSAPIGRAAATTMKTVEIYIGDAPPLTIQENPERGIIGDVVLEAARRAGYGIKLIAVPWARAQSETTSGTDRLIIPLSRTPTREDQYTWISEVMLVGLSFATTGRTVSNYNDAKNTFRSVGFLRGSIGQQVLPRQGFPPDALMALSSYDTELDLLLRGNIDAWFDSIPVMQWILRQRPSIQGLVIGPPVEQIGVYLACSKHCAPDLVSGFQRAIAEIRADGTFARISGKYIAVPPGNHVPEEDLIVPKM